MFRNKNNRPEYELVLDENKDEHLPVSIRSHGVVFSISKVKIREDENNDTILEYQYDILEGTPENKEEFENLIGDIIVDIIEQNVNVEGENENVDKEG